MQGMSKLLETLQLIKQRINHDIEVSGIIGSGLIEVIGFIFILTIKDGKMNTTDMIEKTFKNTKGGLWLSIINTVILALVLIFGGIEKAQQFKKMKKKNNKEQDND